jgi:pimeloyl-ACP methyl ester carboxylesterase
MADHTDTMIEARGCRIRMMRGGGRGGSPLLFLHGAGGAGVWLPFMDRLAERFDLNAPEHPGFGASDTPDWLDTVHDLAYFYLDFLKDHGLRGVHLVGLSLGGWIAAEIAVRCTARLATLTLVDAAGIHLPGVAQSDPFLRSEEQRIRDNFVDQAVADAVVARALAPEMEDVNLKNRTPPRAWPGSRARTTRTCRNGCTGSTCRRWSSGARTTCCSRRSMPRPGRG